MSRPEDQRVRSPKTLDEFSRALSQQLPRRLAQLRALGKATRALPRARPRRRG